MANNKYSLMETCFILLLIKVTIQSQMIASKDSDDTIVKRIVLLLEKVLFSKYPETQDIFKMCNKWKWNKIKISKKIQKIL